MLEVGEEGKRPISQEERDEIVGQRSQARQELREFQVKYDELVQYKKGVELRDSEAETKRLEEQGNYNELVESLKANHAEELVKANTLTLETESKWKALHIPQAIRASVLAQPNVESSTVNDAVKLISQDTVMSKDGKLTVDDLPLEDFVKSFVGERDYMRTLPSSEIETLPDSKGTEVGLSDASSRKSLDELRQRDSAAANAADKDFLANLQKRKA